MSKQLDLMGSQKSTLSLSDSLARICRLLESGEDSELHEAAYSLRRCESLELRSPIILSLKTSKVFSQVTEDSIGLMFLERLPTLGMMVNGNFLIQGGFSPKIESGFTLSDILEEQVDQKYFLSEKAAEWYLKKGMDYQIFDRLPERAGVQTIKERIT